MNETELHLEFAAGGAITVALGTDRVSLCSSFTNLLSETDHRDLRWYVETYGVMSIGEPDDAAAGRIEAKLPRLGSALFSAAFAQPLARAKFDALCRSKSATKHLTIASDDARILELPWELLHDGEQFLFECHPTICIRRCGLLEEPNRALPERLSDTLHILIIVSRPTDAGFLDPRADSGAILDAVEQFGQGRITCEFLRPGTVSALSARLADPDKAPVNILHFDGHGVFDREHEPQNTGYLIFEADDGTSDLVTADRLAQCFEHQSPFLVVLAACQSATVGPVADDPADDRVENGVGSVAVGLIAGGVPSVLAMTHSVLVPTTRQLFGVLYGELASGKTVGEALQQARRDLARHRRRYELQRGAERRWIELSDWFVPALYQRTGDAPLLSAAAVSTGSAPLNYSVPLSRDPGFFGRARELWEIERAYCSGARLVLLLGFQGQGKTALAQEAGRWFVRTDLFQKTVTVDCSGSQINGAEASPGAFVTEALGISKGNAGNVCGELSSVPTLLILDAIDALSDVSRDALLGEVPGWLQVGSSCVLATSRVSVASMPPLRSVVLRVGPLASSQSPHTALTMLRDISRRETTLAIQSEDRDRVVEMLERLSFHASSIAALGTQLAVRAQDEVFQELDSLNPLWTGGCATDHSGAPPAWITSLQPSLDRLDAGMRPWIARLGVFRGAALEPVVIAFIKVLSEEHHRTSDKDVPPAWEVLRDCLSAAGLIELDVLPRSGATFVRFHPLLQLVSQRLSEAERHALTLRYIDLYLGFVQELNERESADPHGTHERMWNELPNVRQSLRAALEMRHPDARRFANGAGFFLRLFGLGEEAAHFISLAAPVQQEACVTQEAFMAEWVLAELRRGEDLYEARRFADAEHIFQSMLARLPPDPSYTRAVVLGQLARCWLDSGRNEEAAGLIHQGLAICLRLRPTDVVIRHGAFLLCDLANAAIKMGEYRAAGENLSRALDLAKKCGDRRMEGTIQMQRASIALREQRYETAWEGYAAATELARALGERKSEAVGLHQMGLIAAQLRRWDDAERMFRGAARLREDCGDMLGASFSWNELAVVLESSGDAVAAEHWLKKVLQVARSGDDRVKLFSALNNIAVHLSGNPHRIAEARAFGEEALNVAREIPVEPGIWNTYGILAMITDEAASRATSPDVAATERRLAREYRRKARLAKSGFAGNAVELKRYEPFIEHFLLVLERPELQPEMVTHLADMERNGWIEMAAACRRILAGERDEGTLCDDLPLELALVVQVILKGIVDRPRSESLPLASAPDA